MKPSDRDAFLKIVIGFAELKGKKLSAPALELYWGAMREWSLVDFRHAAEQLIRTCEFMPTPKDFEDLRKAGRPTAAESWARAVHHASSSAYRDGHLGDAAIDTCVAALGGYYAIAMTDRDKLPHLERRFTEHYEHQVDAQDTRAAVPQLAADTRRQELTHQ